MSNTRLPKLAHATQNQPRLSRRKLYAAMLIASQWMAAGQLWAAPEGGEVVGGEGVIEQSGVDTLIHQATERLAIDWQSFDVAANERVEFIQPSSSSIALNRVLSNNGTQILGRIDSNGQVMVVNPNGVVFGKDSIINVGGMIASGMSIDPASFINGDFTLNSLEGTEGKVINYGIINAATGGSVTLVGQQVQNDGLISAKLGAVNLAAGNEAVLTFDQSGLVGVKVTEAVLQNELGVDAAVINSGAINAEGGRVLLSASVSEDIFSNAVNNADMNRTSSVVVHDDGSFTLGAGADVINTGDIDTSVATGAAGQVVVLGNNVTSSGTITANTGAGTAGAIELHSTDTTLVTETGNVSAQAATQGVGGDIKILGNKVGLLDNAEVNASGASGGGQVLIGGDKTGDNQRVRNADFIYLGENSAVKTDALIDGNGGKLITFASDTARIYGNLYSRGGSEGGNGGFIETSGLKGFEIWNTPDITAAVGTGGTWLIDPYDIEIVNENQTDDNFSAPNTSPFTSSATQGPKLSVTSVRNALVNGSTVIVQTGGSASDADASDTDLGNITLTGALNFNFSGNATLRLLAHNNINLNNNIERANDDVTGTLNLELIANKDNRGGTNGNTLDGANGGNISIANGVTIATNGGYFYAGKSAQEDVNSRLGSDYTNKVFNFTSLGTISTYGNLGGGDIVINATNNVGLGALQFGYNYERADSYANPTTRALVRVGSVTVNSGGDVSLNSAIDFNNTGKRRGDGSNAFAASPAPASEETFFKIDAFGDITINGLISDAGYGDARDSLNIELTADKNNTSINTNDRGTITIANGIYTAGGNFTASGYAFNSSGRVINTDRANALSNSNTTQTVNNVTSGIQNGNAQHSNGGDVTISAVSTVSLGSIVTDAEATRGTRTGNLLIQGVNRNADGISTNNVTVKQNGVWKVAGTTTFNTGTDGDIELMSNNIFNGNLLFASAGDVQLTAVTDPLQLTDTTAITFGASRINGTLELTSGGNITQDGELYVGGTTDLTIANGAANKNVNLSNENNNFVGAVTVTNAADVSLRDEDNLSLAALTTAGNIELESGSGLNEKIILNGNIRTTEGTIDDKNIVLNSNAELGNNLLIQAGTGAISFNGTVNSNNTTAKTLTLTGGNITLAGAMGTSQASDNSQALGAVVLNSSALVSISAPEIRASSFSVIGVGAVADFTLTNLTNNWSITGAKQGTVQRLNNNVAMSPLISFSGVRNISGGSGADNFVIQTADTIASIDGGTGVNTLTGRNVNNDWEINGTNQGVIKQGSTTNVAKFTNIENLIGSTGADTFNFTNPNSVISGAINGGGGAGTNTILGRNTATTWTLTNNNTGNVKATGTNGSIYVESFSNIQNLTGGTDTDVFDFSTQANASITGTVDGGATAEGNEIKARDGLNVKNSWTMTDGESGSLAPTTANPLVPYIASFTDIQIFTGAGEDTMNYAGAANIEMVTLGALGITGVAEFIGKVGLTLVGEDKVNLWSITGNNSGTVSFVSSNVNTEITFRDFSHLTGGTEKDTFDFTNANGVITGTIDGGATAEGNEIKARAGENTWTMTGGESGSLAPTTADPLVAYIDNFINIQIFTGAGEDTMNYSGATGTVEVRLGTSGVSGVSDFVGKEGLTLVGENEVNFWSITSNNSGTVSFGPSNDVTLINFHDFSNLTGGNQADTFTFTNELGSITGTINGGDGTDIITARNSANTWTMTAADTGTLAATPATTYLNRFSDIETLNGGNDADIFNINYSFNGVINGGDGADIFKFDSVLNSGNAASINGGDGNDQLIGRVTDNTWLINSTNSGSLRTTNDATPYVTSFTDLQILTGGIGADTFTINSAFAGAIDAGAGNNIFGVNASVGTLTGGIGNDNFIFGASGRADVIGGDGGINTITGRNTTNTWSTTAVDEGNLSVTNGTTPYLTNFKNIQHLQGGSAVDIFNIDHKFNGTISGGNAADIFNLNADATKISGGAGNDIFNIYTAVTELQGDTGDDSFLFNSALNVGSAASIDGGAAGENNSLSGRNADNIWNITGENTGSLGLSSGSYVTSFSNIQTLNGGSAADNFIINAVVGNTINAGAGNNSFTINAAVSNIFGGDEDETYVFGAAGSAASLHGGGGNNTVVGRNGNNTWTMTAANIGKLEVTNGTTYLNKFENIQTLQGGNGVDIFNLAYDFSGTIKGGAGADIFNVNAVTNILLGEAGDDSFLFNSASNAGRAASIDGGVSGENNSLNGRNANNIWNITGENTGSLGLSSGSYVTGFSNIQNIYGGNAVDIFNLNAAVTTSVHGAAGNDQFFVNAKVGSLFGDGGNDHFLFNSENNSGIATDVDGGDGDNEITGRNAINTWNITATDAGSLAETEGTPYITNFTKIQTLNGGSEADVFEVGANITRAINSGSGNNIFKINTSVNNLVGGAGNDQFIFGATGFAQSIRGAGGINSLTGRDAANTWNITAANAGNIASYLTNFFEIQTLQGGSGTDTFNINAAVENLFGNAGDDKFLFTSNNNTGSAKSIDGGGGNNTLSGRNAENNWTMLAAQSGELSSLINNNNSIYVENFSSIQNIEGGNVTDTLYGLDQNNDWTITGRNSGNLKAAGALAATQVSFTSIENLVGAQGLDKFTFTTNQSYITGRVNGGSSNTVLDEVNLSGLTDGVVVELGNTLSENLNLFNIESVIANKDAHNSNVLIGASDASYSWNITATNSGRIQLTDTSSTDIGVSFTNFGELRGGTNDDRFNVAAGASVSKSISGGDGAGEDWVDYSRRTDEVEITLGGDGLTGTGINGIEGIIGNSLLDNNYKSIIRVIDGDNTWTIDELNDGEVSVGGQRVLFENFNQLIGGSGADTFNYSTQGQLVGLIDGGTGTNRVNASQSTKDHEFHLNGTVAGVTNLVRITELTANAATNSALVSTASANTWTVNSQGIGILNGIFNFSGIANLTGGAFIDEFNLASISPFTGIIDGGAGSAADEIKLNQITTDISVGIGATAVANLKVANIESINANADRTNTFIADNLTDNTWLISGANSGTLNTSIAFSGFSNLAGREAADTFTYASELSNISGWIDAGGGVDKLNLTNSNRNLVVRIVSNNSVVNSGEVTANNFESIDADADNNNKLIAKDTDNTWSITSTNGGSLNDGVSPALAFTNFNNLTGGNQNDTFNFDSLGIITGLIDGAGQRERDTVDVSKSLNTNIKIAAATATSGYSNIEKYIGDNTTSTITADNTANNWVVTNNSGALNSTIEFEQFANLVGGNDQDIFTLNNAILSGYIDGADGNDRFTLTASAVAGELRGGLGDDEFTINVVNGFAGNTNLNGGLGANRLIVTGGDAGYKATHQQSVLEYENSAKAKYTVSYAGITGITDNVVADSLEIWGTSANDVFRLQNNKYQLDPALSISYSQKQDLIIRGSSTDQVVLDGTVTIPKLMIVNNASLTAENGGKLIAQSLELIATQGVGSASNRVQLAVNDLYLKSTNGDIYLNEQDSLNLKEFFTSATNIFDVVLGGDLLSASGISFGGQFNVDALRGGIALNNANSFSGLLNLKAASDISIKNLNALSFTEVAAQNLTIDAEGEVSSTGAMIVNGLTSIATKSNISLLHADNDLNSVRILAANNLSLRDKNSLTLAGVSALGNVAINTSGNINIGSSCTDNCTDVLSMRETKVSASDALSLSADGSYGIRANNVNIDAGIGAITVGKNITANDSVALQGNGITVNDTITAKRISLKAGSGILLLNKNGSLSGQAGDLIDLAAVRVDQRSNITGGADINVTAIEDIQMAADAITESVAGNVVYSGRNIALGAIKSINGVVNLKVSGAITDSNDGNINIYAHRWVADAISGIGIGNLGDAGQDAIETDVDVLSVMNAGKPLNNSTINILNADSLIIEQLRNNGDISIANLTGDIVLDNTNNTPFDIKNPDARLQGGVINANTGLMGGKLTLSIPNGMVVATNKADKSNPDIIAERATFVYSNPPRYGFGDRNRKIVMHIPAVYNQSAKTSSVVWHIKKPLETTDTSTPLKNLNTTDQLIQIEGLSEIDPAIFTNVRNYVHDEVAILMPADQRFDDDDE